MLQNQRRQVPRIPAVSRQKLREVRPDVRKEQPLWLPNFALRQSQLFVHLGAVAELKLPWDRDRDEVRPLMEELAYGYVALSEVATAAFGITEVPYVTDLLHHMEMEVLEQRANGGRGSVARFETRQPDLHRHFGEYASQNKHGLDKPQQEFVVEAAACMYHSIERQLLLNGVGQGQPALPKAM